MELFIFSLDHPLGMRTVNGVNAKWWEEIERNLM
jgi:hypothetical protein